ncbi:MAG: acyl carrier protein [Herpetosiphonaceae bacterium]|nr:acyl carrier protein [Herpetosiphonaceae bacterium]
MQPSRDQILTDFLAILRSLSDDWEYSGELNEKTCLIADMGLESLDIVVLGANVQAQYKQVLPFSEFFAEVGQRELPDITIGEWVDFIHEHLSAQPILESKEGVAA